MASQSTWEQRTKNFAESHARRLSDMLRGLDRFMFAFDNVQAGEKKKDQREGSSSSFWEGMTKVLKKLHALRATWPGSNV
jgi:hypothetical protein